MFPSKEGRGRGREGKGKEGKGKEDMEERGGREREPEMEFLEVKIKSSETKNILNRLRVD